MAVLSWAGTGGVAAAASHGVGIVHPAAGERSTVYLVVRVDAKQHLTPASLRELSDLHAAVVVDRTMCRVQPKALPRLTAEGIPLVLQGSKSLRMVHAPAEPRNAGTGRHVLVLAPVFFRGATGPDAAHRWGGAHPTSQEAAGAPGQGG